MKLFKTKIYFYCYRYYILIPHSLYSLNWSLNLQMQADERQPIM